MGIHVHVDIHVQSTFKSNDIIMLLILIFSIIIDSINCSLFYHIHVCTCTYRLGEVKGVE